MQNSLRPGADKRKAPRVKTFKTGSISLAHSESDWFCILRDISEIGARVQCANAYLIPDGSHLAINLLGIEVRCQTVWQQDTTIGLKFVGRPFLRVTHDMKLIEVSGKQLLHALGCDRAEVDQASFMQ